MLKKTLIALAVASVATAASAADVTDTASALLSKQGAVNTANVQIGNAASVGDAAGDVLVSLEAEYKPDDLLYFDFVGGDVDLTASVITTDVQLFAAPADGGALLGTMVLGLLPSSTKNQLVMRVTSLDYINSNDPLNTTKYGKLVVNGLTFKTTSILSSGKTTLDYRAETSTGIEIDAGKDSATIIFEAKDQFAAAVTHDLDATIDVNEQRLKFVGTGVTAYEDVVTVETTENAAPTGKVWALPATATKSDYVIHGDFSFLGEANDSGIITTSNVTSSADAAPKVYADKIVTTYAGLTANTITIDISGETSGVADKALSPQEFTATTTVAYTDFSSAAGSVILQDKADAGAWGLNGAIIHVPFMPFRDGYSPIVSVSNTSNQDGDIEVLVYAKNDADWVEPTSYMLNTTAIADAMTNITPELQSLGINGDVAFDVIVNAPKQSIAVNALYFNEGDRAVLETHSRN